MEDLTAYWPLLFLLLPVAYLTGWLKGRKNFRQNKSEKAASLSSDYFKGLNYLLSDQQEKALPVFLQLVQVDNETIDTHLALATIFRRSGKLDQAIEVHQNLIARPSLSAEYRSKSLLELGRDYLAAGLFDRAEGLFNDVIKSGYYAREARHYMLTIYQQEKEWHDAIKVAQALIQQGDSTLRPQIAQFYCELGEQFLEQRNFRQAAQACKDALAYYPRCIRSIIIRAKLAFQGRQFKDVIKHVKQVEQTDADYLPVVLTMCIESYRELSRVDELISYLKSIAKSRPELNLTETIVRIMNESGDEKSAFDYLQQQMANTPDITGLSTYVEMLKKHHGQDENNLETIGQILDKMKPKLSQYQCRKCGYTSGTMNWQCPSCLSWGEIKPITGSINAKS